LIVLSEVDASIGLGRSEKSVALGQRRILEDPVGYGALLGADPHHLVVDLLGSQLPLRDVKPTLFCSQRKLLELPAGAAC
jgi:hypothetical protein